MAECKSKKVKGIADMMKALSAQDQQQHVNAYSSGTAFSKKLNDATWIRGQKVLIKKKNYFSRDQDEGDRVEEDQKVSKEQLMETFQIAVQQTTQPAAPGKEEV